MNKIIDKHSPLKKLSKYKLKFQTKPQITTVLQKSISIKNKLFRDFINKKDLTQKAELQIKYKNYRNMLSILMKNSKRNYFTKFFENNLRNLKNTWKSIKSILFIKSFTSNSPMLLLTYQNDNIDNPERIANIFNNYFSTTGEKTQAKTKHSRKNYTDYFSNENPDSFFLSPANKDKIKIILSYLDTKNLLDHTVSLVCLKWHF